MSGPLICIGLCDFCFALWEWGVREVCGAVGSHRVLPVPGLEKPKLEELSLFPQCRTSLCWGRAGSFGPGEEREEGCPRWASELRTDT